MTGASPGGVAQTNSETSTARTRNGLFALYWSSATVSYLGDGVRFAALPLFAASVSSSPGEVATVSAAAGLPWLLFGLVAGVLVDRVDRLRLMAATQVARAVVGGALVAGVAMRLVDIVLLVVLVFLLYTCEVLYDIAFNSALPAVVDRTQLQWANSRLITAEVATVQFAGPALGGVLFALSPLLPFAFDGITFAVSALLLLTVARLIVSTEPRAATNDRPSARTEFVAGLRWFWRHPMVRALTLVGVAVNLAAGGFYAVLVLLVRDEIGAGSVGYGVLLAVGAVGSIVAGMVAGRLTGGRTRRATVLTLAPATALCFTLIAVATNAVMVALAMIMFSFAVTTANVVMVSLRQLLTPDTVLGRVMAVHRFFCWGALPVGAALAGLVGQLSGVREAVAACGIVALVVGLGTGIPLLRLPSRAYTPEHEPEGVPCRQRCCS